MATVVTPFFGKYDVTVTDSAPTVTIDVTTPTADDNTLQENRQEFRDLPQEIIAFVEGQIDFWQADATIDTVELDNDLTSFSRWDRDLRAIFRNRRLGDLWMFTEQVVSQVRELRLNRRTTPITVTLKPAP